MIVDFFVFKFQDLDHKLIISTSLDQMKNYKNYLYFFIKLKLLKKMSEIK